MPPSVASTASSRHPVFPDIARPRMAKADVRKPDMPSDVDWMKAVGEALAGAIAIVGWSSKVASGRVKVDDAEFGKWLSGNRRVQVDRVLAVEELQWPFLTCLAKRLPGVEIETEIRRRA
jgi:hypothetical protein